MKLEFGLIGKKLSHSFSKNFFEEKFRRLALTDHSYHLFEIESTSEIEVILRSHPHLIGLNVTIPYKGDVIPILDKIESNAERIGSVNVIKIGSNNQLHGFNTDYFGFQESIKNWIPAHKIMDISALVLGTGGASKAVACVLQDLKIPYKLVSRTKTNRTLSYEEISGNDEYITENKLIINTTPLGMHPYSQSCPDINYGLLTGEHRVFDLVYNPEETLFLSNSREHGALVKNGLEMLYLQAEKSWDIWTR